MNGNDNKRDDEQAIMIALFRYGVIAELIERDDFEHGERSDLVRKLAKKKHYLPGKGTISVTEKTVYNWLKSYKKGGVQALRPSIRKDYGKSKVIDDHVLLRAIQLRKESPTRYTSTLLDILSREGTLRGKHVPHRSTFDRHLSNMNASRRQLKVLGARRTIKMRFDNFGDIWVGDYHHGPLVLAPDGTHRTSKLGAFIDHTTRYPVSSRYYLDEKIPSLRDTLFRAFLQWGTSKKIYVDRGPVYRSDQLAYSLLQLNTKLIHSRAYYSQGRGVIERWWQLADAFENEVRLRDKPLTIHELNNFWEAYCELRYCQAIHSDLKKTPNEAIKDVKRRPIDPEILQELFLVRADRTVNKKTGCVSIENIFFLCESFLRNQKVQVRYDPMDLSSVLIFKDKKRIQKAFPQQVNAKPEPHLEEPEKITQSVDYLSLLRRDYDEKLLEHVSPLIYTNLTADPKFTFKCFIKILSELAGLKLTNFEKKEAKTFWETLGPIPEELVRIGIEHAVRLHCRGRHIQVYLHSIRVLVMAELKKK